MLSTDLGTSILCAFSFWGFLGFVGISNKVRILDSNNEADGGNSALSGSCIILFPCTLCSHFLLLISQAVVVCFTGSGIPPTPAECPSP